MKKLQTALITIFVLFLFTPLAKADTLDDIKFFVDTYYYGEIPKNLDTMSSVEEIVSALDEYSRYLTADEYREYLGDVAEDKPSSTTTKTAAHKQSIVSSSMLYGNVGYIKITSFSAVLGQEVEAHWLKLQKAGAIELIVDLRYNGGGYVDSAEQLLGFYQGVTDAYHLATREGEKIIKPVSMKTKFPKQSYLLVNRYSASASEIVAAALNDTKAATIVGERTKGKGSVQSIFEFDDGSALKLTVGKFTGPKGTVVHKKGVTPTIKTDLNNELVTTHQRILNETLNGWQYQKLGELQNVPTDKTFHIQFTQPMNLFDAHTSHTIEFVKLGSIAVPVLLQQNTDATIDVIPNKTLQPGGSYVLVIHPGAQNINGRSVKQGIFTPITIIPTAS